MKSQRHQDLNMNERKISSGHNLSPEQLVHTWPEGGGAVGWGELSPGTAADKGHPREEGPFGAELSGLITLSSRNKCNYCEITFT